MNTPLARGVLAGLLLAGLGGCASTPPDPASGYLEEQRARTLPQPQALLIDSCVIRDVFAPRDHVVWSSTRRSAELAERSLRAALNEHGATVVDDSLFTVCAQADPDATQRWAPQPGDPVRSDPPPWANDNERAEVLAVRNLQGATQAAIRGSDRRYRKRALDLRPAAAAVLRQRLQADRVWVMTLAGIDVSPGKQLSKPLIGSLLVFPLLFLGDDLPTIADKDKQRYRLALVDLRDRTLIWWRTSDWRIMETNFGANLDRRWANRALQPMSIPQP